MIDYLALAQSKKDEMVKDLMNWVKIPSVFNPNEIRLNVPFGNKVANALKFMAVKGKSDGFMVDCCDGYCTEITYGDSDEMILVLGHADVVPPGRGWTQDPFTPVVKDNKVIGRGTSDDKGPTLAAYYALKLIKELNIPLKRKIRLVVGGNEETGSRCLNYYFNTLKKPHGKYSFTPDANFPLIYAEKGILTYRYHGNIEDNVVVSFEAGVAANSVPDYAKVVLKGIHSYESKLNAFILNKKLKANLTYINEQTQIEIFGKSAHGGSPQEGVNAASYLIQFIAENFTSPLFKHFALLFADIYGKGLNIAAEDQEMGKVSMNLGIATYQNNQYNFVINIRYPKTVEGNNITKALNQHVLHESTLVNDSKPLYVSPNSDLVKALLNAYQEISGDKTSKPFTISGGTYARQTINSVAFGMCFPYENGNNIHQEDEYVNIDSLVKGTAIYLKALIDLNNI